MIIAAAILLFTLFCAYLSGDREWANVTKAERNDLVFEGRHRDYGAYVLRREYDRRLMIALLIGFGALGLGVAGVKLLVHGGGAAQGPQVRIIDRILEVVDPPPALPDLPPSPPAPPSGGTPTPSIATILILDTAIFQEKDTTNAGPALPPSDSLTTGGGGKGPGGEGPPGGGSLVGGGGEIVPEFIIQERPSFPGGEAALYRWLTTQIRYPDRMADAGEEDKVYVEFVVEADGSISLVKAVMGRHELSKAEAARVVSRFPKWAPGKMNGHPVRCRLTLPVSFRLK